MAEIMMKYDTVTKAMSLSLDGTELTDVCGVSVYPVYSYGTDDDGKFSCDVSMCTESKETGISLYSRLSASAQPGAVPSRDFPGMFESDDKGSSPLDKAVASYFGR